ncbi:MAG: glycosyltransferase family 2 protein [bacterium]|nr:glycosyltransferase family 2 protein [bacterium]
MDELPEKINPLASMAPEPPDPAVDPDALISVIVPLKNEEGTIVELFEGLDDVFRKLDRNYEVIFVDDGSTDSSWQLLKGLYHEYPANVRAIRFRMNKGKAAALAAGFELAEGEIIFTMDADLQDDPNEIPRFLEQLAGGADLVTGYKKKRHDPLHKVLPSRFFNWVVSRAAGLKLHDYNCGFKAYRKEVMDQMNLYGELHRYVPFLANSRGFKVEEIVVQHHARKSGVSKYGIERYFRGFFDLFTVIMLTRFSRKPLHLFGGIGMVLFSIGLIINIWLTWIWLWGAAIGDRPLLFLGVLLMVVGVQIFTIGLIGDMVNSLKPPDEADRPIQKILK